MTFATLFSVALLGLGAVHAAPTPSTNSSAPACVNTFPRNSNSGAPLTTEPFDNKDGQNVSPPYYFNTAGQLAYDHSGTQHPIINAIFQTCTPNYAQDSNDEAEQRLYGRFFIPSINKCLAVTNSSGSAPYYIGTADCPSPADMATEASIPFNFLAGTEDFVDMTWIGNTIPSKNQFQGGCDGGQLLVNATNYHTSNGVGEPNTVADGEEDNRIHLYCAKDGGFNYLVVPVTST